MEMQRQLTNAIHSLVLVRIGQELGSDSPAARTVHDLLELLALFASSMVR